MSMHITAVYPPQVEAGGPVHLQGSELGLARWAVFTDENNKHSLTVAATGVDVGRAADSVCPDGLDTPSKGTIALSDATTRDEVTQSNTSNAVSIGFVAR
ncbi:hypothetical protein ACFVFS_36085 [Kitasatospora sp. NPDC057692]|uniref:hypothetical protein n=1 Tax=Kitasatospora sp. NPDC057692 TaxID=3346215 RepID=UPI00367FD38F